MNPERDAKKKKELKRRAIIMSIIALYIGFWFGAEYLYRNNDFWETLDHVVGDFIGMRPVELGFIHQIPGPLALFPVNPIWPLLAIGVVFFIILGDYLNYIINKNTMPGEEHGSATFNTEWTKVEHDCMMSTKFLRQGKEANLFQKILKEGNTDGDLNILFRGMDTIKTK